MATPKKKTKKKQTSKDIDLKKVSRLIDRKLAAFAEMQSLAGAGFNQSAVGYNVGLHSLMMPTAGHPQISSAMMFPPPPFIWEITRFFFELYWIPSKIDNIIRDLQLDTPVPNPLNDPFRPLRELKRLIEEVREHIENHDFEAAKEKAQEAHLKALTEIGEIFSAYDGDPKKSVDLLAEVTFVRDFLVNITRTD